MHFVGKCPAMSAVRLGVVVWSPFSRAAAGGKFVAPLTMFALQESVCWSETYFREHDRADSFVACTCFYIAEDAESTEKLISTGLASGGIITLE